MGGFGGAGGDGGSGEVSYAWTSTRDKVSCEENGGHLSPEFPPSAGATGMLMFNTELKLYQRL